MVCVLQLEYYAAIKKSRRALCVFTWEHLFNILLGGKSSYDIVTLV